jgi:hypothetical protein
MLETGFQCLRLTGQSLGSIALRTGMTDKIPVCLSSAERVFECRHWSPGLGKYSVFQTGFQCLRFRKLRTGKTEKGKRSLNPSLLNDFYLLCPRGAPCQPGIQMITYPFKRVRRDASQLLLIEGKLSPALITAAINVT